MQFAVLFKTHKFFVMKETIGSMKGWKFLALMLLVTLAGTLIALALVKLVPDTKQPGSYRLKLGGASKAKPTAPATV